MKLYTVWGEKLDKNNPLPEYPRPQLVRDSYFNLNGQWNYRISQTAQGEGYDGTITVPFSPECLLSGVGRVLMPEETLVYNRTFNLPEGFIKDKTFLHFGAVDYICKVTLNGVDVGGHRGGYTPFSLDVSSAVREGENTVTVSVTDPSDTGVQSRGKQKLNAGTGIWYTPQSGIWQTVWLESVNADYVHKVRFTPDIDNGRVCIEIFAGDYSEKAFTVIKLKDKTVFEAETPVNEPFFADIPDQQLWSPENPVLYDVFVTIGEDTVMSYFGMRKFSQGRDKDGNFRLMLNNEPYFYNGLLDQGYWSDGMYTPPSDEAMIYDIELAKKLGFNMLRKHIKIEPLRWYYHCDRLGMICWQDMINGGGQYKFSRIATLPFLGLGCDDSQYAKFAREDKAGRDEYYRDLADMIDTLYNSVCISLWTIFNEAWGQFDSKKVYEFVRSLDCTRTVDPASGWYDQKGMDIKSVHKYFVKYRYKKDSFRPLALSEFGGYSIQVKDHVFTDKIFGYKVFRDKDKFMKAFGKLYLGQIVPALKKGLAACVYTQLSDVESEINGLVTYDRKVVKVDPVKTAEICKLLKL